MPPLHVAQTFNASYSSKISYTPVAVFIGGTAGIGEATIRALARYLHGRVHVILLARTQKSGERVLFSLEKPNDVSVEVMREFIYCDASLMSSVHAACMEITRLLETRLPKLGIQTAKINYLVFSAAYSNLKSSWTEEGIDKQLAVRYYHRFKATYELLPLLRNAKDLGEDARVLSILASGFTWPFDENDFGYKKRRGLGLILKGANTNMTAGVYNDLMVESFAERYPGISFTHAMPGMVSTENALQHLTSLFTFHWILKPLETLLQFIFYMLFILPEHSAEYHLYGLLSADENRNGEIGKKSFYRRSRWGNEFAYRYHRKDQERLKKQLWEHTIKETKCVE
ncbi:hypothetical protein VKT23_011745 [Stygiomarasmius scandens]|uniref:NAD(P)-binding protein n=1 Tax=Marasmiellus scandens TaxID=2682957 RepID=A0ABR1JAK1_9AGAR